jgi:hypothetical protein
MTQATMKSLVLISFTLMLSFGCGNLGTSYDGDLLGRFIFTAYDTLGNSVIYGTLGLYQSGAEIAGFWKLQNGESGDLEGSIDSTQMNLNLNPGFVDNNLILQGTLAGKRYSGLWQKIGFPGVIAQGHFDALKQ